MRDISYAMLVEGRASKQTDETHDMRVGNRGRLADMNRPSEQYGKPFEAEHRGEYIAISRDSCTLLGKTPYEAAALVRRTFGRQETISIMGSEPLAGRNLIRHVIVTLDTWGAVDRCAVSCAVRRTSAAACPQRPDL